MTCINIVVIVAVSVLLCTTATTTTQVTEIFFVSGFGIPYHHTTTVIRFPRILRYHRYYKDDSLLQSAMIKDDTIPTTTTTINTAISAAAAAGTTTTTTTTTTTAMIDSMERFIELDSNDWTPLNTNCFSKFWIDNNTNTNTTTNIDYTNNNHGRTNKSDIIVSSQIIYYPRIAASIISAQTILHQWQNDEVVAVVMNNNDTKSSSSSIIGWSTEWKSVTYYDTLSSSSSSSSISETIITNTNRNDGIPLYGYMIRNAKYHQKYIYQNNNNNTDDIILLFPTAVGVHDLFLFYKATQIVNHISLQHTTVFIIDIHSDISGWLWDKTNVVNQLRYTNICNEILQHNNNSKNNTNVEQQQQQPYRPILQNRIHAALNFLYQNQYIQSTTTTTTTTTTTSTKIAALGWCFGGHGITELARMTEQIVGINHIRAMITFHGVFTGLNIPVVPSSILHKNDDNEDTINEDNSIDRPPRKQCEVLICHGIHDPFVPSNDLEKALELFQYYGYTTSLLQLDAKHGFTNPAQIHNMNPSFGYNEESSNKAWHQALALLKRRIGR